MLSYIFLGYAVVHLAIWFWGWSLWVKTGRPVSLFLILFGGTLLFGDADVGELVRIEVPQRLSGAVSPQPESNPFKPGKALVRARPDGRGTRVSSSWAGSASTSWPTDATRKSSARWICRSPEGSSSR